MMLYGELYAFSCEEAAALRARARAALAGSGRVQLEVSRVEALREEGTWLRSWRTAERGLFADRPHLVLEEAGWDETARSAASRWYVVDAATAEVELHGEVLQAYDDAALDGLLAAAGLALERRVRSLAGDAERDPGLSVMIARAR